MKYGIFFRHPLDRDRGLCMIDNFYFKRIGKYGVIHPWYEKDFKRDDIKRNIIGMNYITTNRIINIMINIRYSVRNSNNLTL